MNKEQIESLWDEITPKLYGYLVNTLYDRTLADDVLQTTWLKAIEALPHFEDRGRGHSAWIFAIARNECRQEWRKRGREVSLDLLLHDLPAPSSQDETKLSIDRALLGLREDEQELVRLRYIADLPFRDIARILKINPITLRVRTHRALATLRSLMLNE